MKTIGVVADTHIGFGGRRALPSAMLRRFETVDLILHAGDVTAQRVLDELGALAPVYAVRGNNDAEALGLPATRRVAVEDVIIGLCHGDTGVGSGLKPLANLRGNGITAANALSRFEFDHKVRCIVFGHSHNPLISLAPVAGRPVTLFNPGSPTDKRWGPHYGYGLIRVDGAQLETELITWD